MNRYARGVAVIVGALAILASLVVAVTMPASESSGAFAGVAGLLALVGVLVALWKVRGSVDGEDDRVAPPPWSEAGALVERAPERTRANQPLSGTGLGSVVETAGEAARAERSVEAGVAGVRPELRAALVGALVQGGADDREAEAALAAGNWTDDRMAASVLDEGVSPPDRSLRPRLAAWLFPEREVVRRTGRAVQAIAEVTDEALPTVVGQRAPRSVPVLPPTLEELQRAADGEFRPAVDPETVARGPEPRRPTEADGDEVGRADADRADGGDDDGSDGADASPRDGGEEPTSDAATGRRAVRWRGGVAAAVLLAVAGASSLNGTLLLAAAVPLVYVAYGLLSTAAVPAGLVAERTVEPATAVPGQPVTVTVTVRNGSDRTLSDVRVVDVVPESLAVMSGTPRSGTTLGPGEARTVEYVLVARRGTHAFDGPRIRLRNPGAGVVATATLDAAGDEELVCRLDADAPPVAGASERFVGHHTADQPGEGIEFHSVREHRPGDPAGRIDWRNYAKRRTLATVNYQRRVATTVVLVLDARSGNRVVAGPGRPTAVELGAYAATRALTDLLRDGRDVAVAVVGCDGPGPAGLHWLPPGGGPAQRGRALELFRTGADESETDAQVDAQIANVAALAPSRAQLVWVSPLLDDVPVDAVETWRASGFEQVVLSPDVLSENTVGGQFAGVRRRTRLARCQATGARTIDWRRGTPLPLVVAYALATDARLPDGVAGRAGGGG